MLLQYKTDYPSPPGHLIRRAFFVDPLVPFRLTCRLLWRCECTKRFRRLLTFAIGQRVCVSSIKEV